TAVNEKNKGNQKLINPVGLITADESAFAGGKGGTANSTFYLYTNQNYWTLSPGNFRGFSSVFYLHSGGFLSHDGVRSSFGVRPAVSLQSNSGWKSGNGTASSPYEVKVK
ncbi:MAG: hypothetical protein RSB41_04635, partial [Bacilli bacterium]